MNRNYRNSSTIVTTMSQHLTLSFILGVSILSFAAPSVAQADVLYTNFGVGQTYDINSGNPVGNAFDGNDWAEANTFTPSVSGKLQSLQLALSCAFACPDPVTVSLNSDAGNQPGLVLESFSVAGAALGPIGTNNVPVLLNSVLLPQLLAGVQYWVAVSGPLTDTVAWNLNSTGDVSDQAISTDGGASWFAPSGNTPGALEVDASTVPEPSSFVLLVSVGLLVSRAHRRRPQ
jgi:hypothetical protein